MAPAEDPRQMYASAATENEKLLAKVEAALRDLSVCRGQLETRARHAREAMAADEDNARRAVAAGHDDAARTALHRHRLGGSTAGALETHIVELAHEERRLADVKQQLVARIETLVARQELVAVRYTAAEAEARVNEALGQVSPRAAEMDLEVQRAESRTREMRARASALEQLAASSPDEERLGALARSQEVEEQLAAMKRELRPADRSKQGA